MTPTDRDRELAREALHDIGVIFGLHQLEVVSSYVAKAREEGRTDRARELIQLIVRYHSAVSEVYNCGLDGERIALLRACMDTSQPIYDDYCGMLPLFVPEES